MLPSIFNNFSSIPIVFNAKGKHSRLGLLEQVSLSYRLCLLARLLPALRAPPPQKVTGWECWRCKRKLLMIMDSLSSCSKIDGNCYEIYGWEEKKGKVDKIEVYFNPVNGDIVKKEVS
jgi:hypothetical protein